VKLDRKALALDAACSFDFPARKLLMCAVTGTNGKTTSTFILESILKAWGKKVALLGTIENRFEDFVEPATLTTLDPIALHKLLNFFKKNGADAVAMEVSSHAIDQDRTFGIPFKAALFTNLTQDHLDYHKSMEVYFQVKSKFFLEYSIGLRVIHKEDPYGEKLIKLCKQKSFEVITFGKENANINYKELDCSATGIAGRVQVDWNNQIYQIPIVSSLLGEFNVQNITGCVAVALGLGVPPEKIVLGVQNMDCVPGRMEIIPNQKNFTVVVDYAHTPDALEKALSALKKTCKKRLFSVFGCGGNRDTTKRPLMGAVTEKICDHVFITSDNPREEDPQKIIEDILKGCSNLQKITVVLDRKEAISKALSSLDAGDTLLIAGKGHENYQIWGQTKLPFDDRKVALEYLQRICRSKSETI